MWAVGTGATGTLRVNRKGLPKKLKDAEVEKGKVTVMHNDNLIAAKYHDRKIVYLLSTVETAIMTKTKKEKRFADGTREMVLC